MATPGWLIDTSALVRVGTSPDAETWTDSTRRGLIHVCVLTLLELGYSARTGDQLRQERDRPPIAHMPIEGLTPAVEDRALRVQELLADRGRNRAPSIIDLLLAAIAERAGLTVLHVDKDFDLIAAVTGQPVERLRLPEDP